MPRVSVIIPCYRDAVKLGRALGSLRAQTRPPDEIIVVDDGSAEGELIRETVARFPGTIYLPNPENLGLAAARNRGLERSTSDVVTFMDADDEAHPQRIEWQLKYVAEDSAVACDIARVPPNSPSPVNRRFASATVDSRRGVGTMIYSNRLTGASLMAPAALLRSVGGYDAALRSCEDFDLWLRLLAGGVTVRRIRLPLYIYHENPAGLSRRYQDIAHWELAVVGKFIATGHFGAPRSLRVGTIWTAWLLRHFARAAATSSPVLREQALANLARLDAWPIFKRLVRLMDASGILRFWRL